LPRNLSGLIPVELVELALEQDSAAFKRVSAELEKREPCPAAAQVLVEAYRDGRAPAFLVAHLLGQLRAPIGYPVAREILLAGMGALTESYAGVAMGRIGGMAAREELLGIVTGGETRRIREGAAYGLGHIADLSLAEAVLAAFRAGHIRQFCAGRVVAALPGAASTIRAWLAGHDVHQETVAIEAASRLADEEVPMDRALAQAIEDTLAARRVKVAPGERRRLEARIAPMLTPTEG
jgi:hypothetical protein